MPLIKSSKKYFLVQNNSKRLNFFRIFVSLRKTFQGILIGIFLAFCYFCLNRQMSLTKPYNCWYNSLILCGQRASILRRGFEICSSANLIEIKHRFQKDHRYFHIIRQVGCTNNYVRDSLIWSTWNLIKGFCQFV